MKKKLVSFFLFALFLIFQMPGSTQAMPPGTIGWITPFDGFFPDPGSACVAEAQSHFGTELIRIIPESSIYEPQRIHYLCNYYHSTGFKPRNGYGITSLRCETGYTDYFGVCRPSGNEELPVTPQLPPSPPKSCRPTDSPMAGNPVVLSTGAKYETAIDFQTAGPRPLTLSRTYRSSSLFTISAGLNWQHNFERYIDSNRDYAIVFLEDGSMTHFQRAFQSNIWNPVQQDRDVSLIFIETESAWEFTNHKTGRVDRFEYEPLDRVYKLVRSVERDGYTVNITIDSVSGYPAVVTDSFGRTLTFTAWDRGMLDETIADDGTVIDYVYDSNQRLTDVHIKDSNGVILKTTQYHYEHPLYNYLLTGITDGRGIRFATFEYDDLTRVTVSEHAGGADRNEFAYDDNANTRTVTNALGKNAIYKFSKRQGRLKLDGIDGEPSTLCPATATSQTYDANGFINSTVDEEGRTTTYLNDSKGRPTEMVEGAGTPEAVTTTMSWHPTDNLPTQIVKPSVTETLEYDAAHRLTRRVLKDTTSHTVPYSTNGEEREWKYTYTTEGLLDTVDGPLSGITDVVDYDYDAQGFLSQIKNPLGHVTLVQSVNGRGQPTQVLDPNGVTLNLDYNALGLLKTVTTDPGPNEAKTEFFYNGIDQITQVTRPDGSTFKFEYDDARRLESVENGQGERIEYVRDAMGNVQQTLVKEAGGAIRYYLGQIFDELGRIVLSLGAIEQVTLFTYEKNGNLQAIVDPRGHVYAYGYDSLNRLIVEINQESGLIYHSLDGQGEVAALTDPNNLTTFYVRNGFGEVIRRVSPDSGITDYERDERGLVTKVTDARGIQTLQNYDALERLTERSFVGTSAGFDETQKFFYDDTVNGNHGIGRLTRIEDEAGSTDYRYNALGQLIQEKRTIANNAVLTTEYAYDPAGNLTKTTYPTGHIINYTRDSEGQISAVQFQAAALATPIPLATDVSYLPFGPATWKTYGNGVTEQRGYAPDYGLETIRVEPSVLDLTYQRTDKVNITGVVDGLGPRRNRTFAYTPSNRLETATGSWGTDTYQYDANGNRTQVNSHDGQNVSVQTYEPEPGTNRLSRILEGGNIVRNFINTPNGNTTVDSRVTGNFVYEYGLKNRISKIIAPDGTEIAHFYDAFSRLASRQISQTISGNTTTNTSHYIYGPDGNRLAEFGVTDGTINEYFWLNGELLAVTKLTPSSGDIFFVHNDHIRPVAMTDFNQTIAWDSSYHPFGATLDTQGTKNLDTRFPGQWHLEPSELSYNWNRYYDPKTGRYLQVDPIGLDGGINLYEYAKSNPVNFFDLEGKYALKIIGLGILAYNFYNFCNKSIKIGEEIQETPPTDPEELSAFLEENQNRNLKNMADQGKSGARLVYGVRRK